MQLIPTQQWLVVHHTEVSCYQQAQQHVTWRVAHLRECSPKESRQRAGKVLPLGKHICQTHVCFLSAGEVKQDTNTISIIWSVAHRRPLFMPDMYDVPNPFPPSYDASSDVDDQRP